jgi:hypothetical protein
MAVGEVVRRRLSTGNPRLHGVSRRYLPSFKVGEEQIAALALSDALRPTGTLLAQFHDAAIDARWRRAERIVKMQSCRY